MKIEKVYNTIAALSICGMIFTFGGTLVLKAYEWVKIK